MRSRPVVIGSPLNLLLGFALPALIYICASAATLAATTAVTPTQMAPRTINPRIRIICCIGKKMEYDPKMA
jgi:hypothetical protein